MAKKDELQAKARELGVDDSGTVAELEERIAAADAAQTVADDRKVTGDPDGFANAPGQGADGDAYEVTPHSGFDPANVIDNPVANDRRQDGARASKRGVYLDRDGRRRVVAAGDRIPDGWKAE